MNKTLKRQLRKMNKLKCSKVGPIRWCHQKRVTKKGTQLWKWNLLIK
jgi:hypothetical protein